MNPIIHCSSINLNIQGDEFIDNRTTLCIFSFFIDKISLGINLNKGCTFDLKIWRFVIYTWWHRIPVWMLWIQRYDQIGSFRYAMGCCGFD